MPIGFPQSPNRAVTPCRQGEEMLSNRNHRTQPRLVISSWGSQSMESRWPVPCGMVPSCAKPFSMGNARIRHPARVVSTGVQRLPRRNGFAAPRGTGQQHAVITRRPEAARGGGGGLPRVEFRYTSYGRSFGRTQCAPHPGFLVLWMGVYHCGLAAR